MRHSPRRCLSCTCDVSGVFILCPSLHCRILWIMFVIVISIYEFAMKLHSNCIFYLYCTPLVCHFKTMLSSMTDIFHKILVLLNRTTGIENTESNINYIYPFQLPCSLCFYRFFHMQYRMHRYVRILIFALFLQLHSMYCIVSVLVRITWRNTSQQVKFSHFALLYFLIFHSGVQSWNSE